MIPSASSILDSVTAGRLDDALEQSKVLSQSLNGGTLDLAGTLNTLERARLIAIANRAQLVQSLVDLQSSRLYRVPADRDAYTWQLNG